jgi:hypothetical protein
VAHYNHLFVESGRAASQINCWEPVRGLIGASSIDETIIPARGSANQVIGISIATVANGCDRPGPPGPSRRSTPRTRSGPLLVLDGENDHTVPWAANT